MSLAVAKSVREAVSDPDAEELSFRVIADLPVAELLDLVESAMDDFERDWDDDPPVLDDRGPIVSPAFAVSPATPDVLVSMIKLSDVPTSFERAVAAIGSRLDSVGARGRVDKPRRARIAVDTPVAMLSLRVNLRGHWTELGGYELDVDESAIRARCVAWLRQFAPASKMQLLGPDFRFSPVDIGTELETWLGITDQPTTELVAIHGDEVRGIALWRPHGWLSVLAGTTSCDALDWRRYWEPIDDLFRDLEPFTDSAIVGFARSVLESAVTTHTNRNLQAVPGRDGAAAAHIGRALEDSSLIDAEGRFFKATTSDTTRIGSAWARGEYGHLTQFDAPDIDDWLSGIPTEATLSQGREDLAEFLQQRTRSD